MNEDNSKPLVERYYKWEKSVWTIALLLIVWQVFGLNDATSLPLLDVELRDPGKFPLVTSIILAVGLLFLWIEWKQSDETARRASMSRIRFGITLILAVAAVWLNLPALTKGTAIADIPRLWLVGYFALGIFTGVSFSMVTLTRLTALFKNNSRTGLLQYTPAATQFVYWHCFKMLFASSLILNVASKFAPIEILAIVPLLVGVPAIALLTAEISGYFFFHHCGDNPLSMPQQISDLKEILPRNRYLNFLDTHRQNAVVKIASNPRLTSQKQQQAVRKYLAKINYGVAPLVIKPLDDFKVSFFPKDGDSSNQAKNNLGIKFELGDSNRKSVKFRIWPEGEDPPKKIDELDVKVDVLEHFAVEYFDKINNSKSTGDDALDYIVTSSISKH